VIESGSLNIEKYNKFLKEVARPLTKPEWNTPNEPVLDLPNVTLRNFSKKGADHKTPVLIIPPQAGHHSSIADYGPEQSLVEAIRSVTGSVYVTEWKAADPERKNETIDDSVKAMDQCVHTVCKKGSKVNLIGLCQGGWQSAIYTALFPEKVKSITLAAAPIDFKAGSGKIQFYTEIYPMFFYESLVAMGGGTMPGEYMKLGFKMLNPVDRFILDYSDLYSNINDGEYTERYRKFRNWYEYTQNLPGRMYLQIVKELFKENRLINGGLKILGKGVNLHNIRCPLVLIAGETDDITPREQVFNTEKHVSSKDIMKLTVPAGHIGVFMGKKILKEYWPHILKKICSRTSN